jgi:hypothetical protein
MNMNLSPNVTFTLTVQTLLYQNANLSQFLKLEFEYPTYSSIVDFAVSVYGT